MQPNAPSSTTMPPPPRPMAVQHDRWSGRTRRRSLHVALFFACIAWYRIAAALAISTANGFAIRFDLADEQPLIEAAALLFLIVIGLSALRTLERTVVPFGISVGLPRRSTSGQEWARGAALGWGISVATALVLVLTRSLHAQLWTSPRAFWLVVVSGAALGMATLAKLLALYGYGLQHLVDGVGAIRATAIFIVLVVLEAVVAPGAYGSGAGTRFFVLALGALLLCLCWLRTRGLWVGWGCWFAWAVSTTLIFGLPLGANRSYSGVVNARAIGSPWLTGGDFGPPASVVLELLLVAGIPVLIRLTDEYAWQYTRRPLVPAGIPVDIPSPAAHAAMEEVPAAAPASLVQIQPIRPAGAPENVTSE